VLAVAEIIGRNMPADGPEKIVMMKSPVPVGTAAKVCENDPAAYDPSHARLLGRQQGGRDGQLHHLLPENIAHLICRPEFRFAEHNATSYTRVEGALDGVLHFASPAIPVDYLKMPIPTLEESSLGTHKTLGLAKAKGARYLLASTSEVYCGPEVHPQLESYWGHVNPVGPRGVYDDFSVSPRQ
jgi:hypothetical protein